MKEEIMNNTSKTEWARIDAMMDDDIDTSDIPPLTDEFFAKAKLRMPTSKINTVAVSILKLWHGFDRKVRNPIDIWLLH
jgi:hypothetical protein